MHAGVFSICNTIKLLDEYILYKHMHVYHPHHIVLVDSLKYVCDSTYKKIY